MSGSAYTIAALQEKIRGLKAFRKNLETGIKKSAEWQAREMAGIKAADEEIIDYQRTIDILAALEKIGCQPLAFPEAGDAEIDFRQRQAEQKGE